MQYDSIEELTLELALYPNKKFDILRECAKKSKYGWFTVAKDGQCALFDSNGELDDINKVKSIDESMILSMIPRFIMPDSVNYISYWAFTNQTQLEHIQLGESLVKVGAYAFANCSKLNKLVFPSKTTTICHHAFFGCENLEEMTFTGKILGIGENAFHSCDKLKKVTFMQNTMLELQTMPSYPFGMYSSVNIECI